MLTNIDRIVNANTPSNIGLANKSSNEISFPLEFKELSVFDELKVFERLPVDRLPVVDEKLWSACEFVNFTTNASVLPFIML